MKTLQRLIYLVMLLVVLNVSLFTHAQQGTRTLRVPEDFSTISQALREASDGDTIEVNADFGPYIEGIIVLDGVSLQSVNGEAMIIGKNSRPGCSVGDEFRQSRTRCDKDRQNLILMGKNTSISNFLITGEFDTWTYISCTNCLIEHTRFLDTNILLGGDEIILSNAQFDYSPEFRTFDPEDPEFVPQNEDKLFLLARVFNLEILGGLIFDYESPDNSPFF